MDEQMKEGLALGGSSKAHLWGSEVGGVGVLHEPSMNMSGGKSPTGSYVYRSGAGGDSDCCLFGEESKN